MIKNKRFFYSFTVIVLALALCASFVYLNSVAQASKDVLNWGKSTEPATLDPRSTGLLDASGRISTLIYSQLFYINENNSFEKELAKSIENPDDKTYIFVLHQGVKFHDGVELTAEDVVYTFETVMDPEFGSPHYAGLQMVESVRALDKYTVEIITKEADPVIMYDLDLCIVPKHLAPDTPGGDFSYQPVGSGPFKLVRWDPMEIIVLERFDDYFEGPAKLKTINVRYLPEGETRFAELMGGGIDLTYVPTIEIERMKENPNFEVQGYFSINVHPIFIQHDHEILSDVRVRQALAHGADFEEIVDHIYSTGTRATSLVIPETWAYSPEHQKSYEYNPEKAKELLAEAGYPNGLTITLKTSSASHNVQVAELLKHYWGQIGIDLNHEASEWATFFDSLSNGDFELGYAASISNIYDPDHAYRRIHTENILPHGRNWGNYSNPELDKIIDEARSIVGNQDRRMELYWEAQRIETEDLPVIPVRNTSLYRVWNKDLDFEWLRGTEYRVLHRAFWK